MTDKEVMALFQEIRKAYLKKAIPAFALAIAGFLGSYIAQEHITNEFLSKISFVISLAAIVGGIGTWVCLTNKMYRCPKCNAVPSGVWYFPRSDYGFGGGVILNPDACPKCGVPFKEPDAHSNQRQN